MPANAQQPHTPTSNSSVDGLAIVVLGLQPARLISAQVAGRSYIDPGSGSFAIFLDHHRGQFGRERPTACRLALRRQGGRAP